MLSSIWLKFVAALSAVIVVLAALLKREKSQKEKFKSEADKSQSAIKHRKELDEKLVELRRQQHEELDDEMVTTADKSSFS